MTSRLLSSKVLRFEESRGALKSSPIACWTWPLGDWALLELEEGWSECDGLSVPGLVPDILPVWELLPEEPNPLDLTSLGCIPIARHLASLQYLHILLGDTLISLQFCWCLHEYVLLKATVRLKKAAHAWQLRAPENDDNYERSWLSYYSPKWLLVASSAQILQIFLGPNFDLMWIQ